MKKLSIEPYLALPYHQKLYEMDAQGGAQQEVFKDLTAYRVVACSKVLEQLEEVGFFASLPSVYHTRIAEFLIDLTCFIQRDESRKIQWIFQSIERKSYESLFRVLPAFRWLHNRQIQLHSDVESIQALYDQNVQDLANKVEDLLNVGPIKMPVEQLRYWNTLLQHISRSVDVKTRKVLYNDVEWEIPEDFLVYFQRMRRINKVPKENFASELILFIFREYSPKASAYGLEDLVYGQIANVEDLASHQREELPIDLVLDAMQDNVNASVEIWSTVQLERKKNPDKPVFIIANERTGPADVATFGLSAEFIKAERIQNDIDYDNFFLWCRQNAERISAWHVKLVTNDLVDPEFLSEVSNYIDVLNKRVFPFLRIRIPSNHYENTGDEPAGFQDIILFIKCIALLRGTIIFVDESTRSVSRSIEILYSGLVKRERELGGVELEPVGQICGIKGQRGVILNQIQNLEARTRAVFIDPWRVPQKPIPDDSMGFVPSFKGEGIIQIENPGLRTLSPFGVLLLSELWQILIADGMEKELPI